MPSLTENEAIDEMRPTGDDTKSALSYHRLLGPSCGVRVSPLCLGAMNFGDAWTSFMGKSKPSVAIRRSRSIANEVHLIRRMQHGHDI